MFFQFHTKGKVTQKTIQSAVASDRFTIAQLKCMADWWLRVSSAGYIGMLILIGNLTISTGGLNAVAAAFGIAMFLLSILFCWIGLCDCEAAKQKELLEQNAKVVTPPGPEEAARYRPGRCSSYPRTSRSRAYPRKIRPSKTP